MTLTHSIGELFDEIGFRKVTVDGEMVWELPVAPHVVNTGGGLQGGLIATLVDVVAGSLCLAETEDGEAIVTSDLHVRYLRPVTTGLARASARVVHSGKRSVIFDVEITALPAEELAAVATISFAKVVRRIPLPANISR